MSTKKYKYISWDRDFTHGGHPDAAYVNYQNNSSRLKVLAPYLASAYRKRVEKHEIYTKGLQNTVISLLERLVILWRERLYQKNGIKK